MADRRVLVAALKRAQMLLWLLLLAAAPWQPSGASPQAEAASGSLRIVSMEVPSVVPANASQVTLICEFELAGEQLHSVKWYKNYVEFYRFQRDELQPQQEDLWKHQFELAGINVNLARSNSTHVHLRQLSLASEGTYRCEVLTESFTTVSTERQLKVYVLPKQKLSIHDNNAAGLLAAPLNQSLAPQAPTKQNSIYNINDLLNLTCVAGASRPAAKLTWLINDQPVPADSGSIRLYTLQPDTEHQQLVETRLELSFRLQPSHLLGQRRASSSQATLRLHCSARLAAEFYAETSVSLPGGAGGGLLARSSAQRRQRADRFLASRFQSSAGEWSSPAPDAANLFRWPQGVASGAAAWRAGARRQPEAPSNSPGADDDQHSIIAMAARASRPPIRTSGVWNSRQLRLQVEHVDYLQRQSRPNELEPPIVEARSLLESGGSGAEQLYDSEYHLDDQVQFYCWPRFGLPNRNATKSLRFVWFINNKEVHTDKVNAYDGTNFYYSPHPSEQPQKGQADAPFPKGVPELIPIIQANDKLTNQTVASSLSIKLTPSIFQVGELSLRCQTRVEQTLIEFESHLVVSVPAAHLEVAARSGDEYHAPQQKASVARGKGYISNESHQHKARNHNRKGQSSGTNMIHHTVALLPLVVLISVQQTINSLNHVINST